MTTAQQIKYAHTEINRENGIERVKDYADFVDECESRAVDIEQDSDAESTTYEFADGSVILWANSEIWAYGSK